MKAALSIPIALIMLIAGCSSTPVALGPVGPSPIDVRLADSSGNLLVFSKEIRRLDDQSQGGDGMPPWYRHSDYKIYTPQGALVKAVRNNTGHYSDGPLRVALAPGNYIVQAQAKDYLLVKVPVTILAGRTTSVHLDDKWKPPADVPAREVSIAPNGIAVGWAIQQ